MPGKIYRWIRGDIEGIATRIVTTVYHNDHRVAVVHHVAQLERLRVTDDDISGDEIKTVTQLHR